MKEFSNAVTSEDFEEFSLCPKKRSDRSVKFFRFTLNTGEGHN